MPLAYFSHESTSIHNLLVTPYALCWAPFEAPTKGATVRNFGFKILQKYRPRSHQSKFAFSGTIPYDRPNTVPPSQETIRA